MIKTLFWRVAIVLVLTSPFITDWLLAKARLSHISVETSLDKETVIADGKSEVVITIKISQDGKPRVNDLVQAWIQQGSGLLRPQWVYTDEQGNAQMTFEPNPLSPYDNQEEAIISIVNISVGNLIEVRKEASVLIPLEKPNQDDAAPKSILGL